MYPKCDPYLSFVSDMMYTISVKIKCYKQGYLYGPNFMEKSLPYEHGSSGHWKTLISVIL